MKTALLIAEKPSLSHDIERVYKAHRDEIPYNIIFKEQRGNLVEECMPGELDARQHSDYRVGMNLSRAGSLKMTGRVSVGRVKTPSLIHLLPHL